MELEKVIHTKWRTSILKVFYIISFIVFLVETAVGIVLWTGNQIDVPLLEYIGLRILLPTILNFGSTFVASVINTSDGIKDEIKDFSIMIVSFVLALIIIVFHSYFTSTIAIMLLPSIVGIFIGNKKIFRINSILALCGSIVHFYLQSTDYMNAPTYYYLMNYGVFIVVLVAIYFIGLGIINCQREMLDRFDSDVERLKKENWDVIHEENTNLYNFIALKAKLKDYIKKHKDGDIKSLALAALQIDDYKSLCSNYGQDVGKNIIYSLADLLNEQSNDNVFIAKAEESDGFLILFNDLIINDIIEILKNIKEAIYRSDNVLISEGNITFATGVIEFENSQNDDSFMKNCYKALDQAKENGKNQTVIVR